jgi:hypothetical protein
MSRNIYFTNGNGEQKRIGLVQNIEDNGMFFRVEHLTTLSKNKKITNVRKDRVIRYDE